MRLAFPSVWNAFPSGKCRSLQCRCWSEVVFWFDFLHIIESDQAYRARVRHRKADPFWDDLLWGSLLFSDLT